MWLKQFWMMGNLPQSPPLMHDPFALSAMLSLAFLHGIITPALLSPPDSFLLSFLIYFFLYRSSSNGGCWGRILDNLPTPPTPPATTQHTHAQVCISTMCHFYTALSTVASLPLLAWVFDKYFASFYLKC